MTRVSVVIPSFNAAPFIGDAVRSAWRQTLRPAEVLVVDDGSTDATVAEAEAAGARVIRTPSNGGPATARNVGIREASGDLIAFLDADDVWEPEHVAACVDLLERFPEVAVAFSPVTRFGAEAQVPASAVPSGRPVQLRDELWVSNPVPQSGAVARRSALLEAGGYREGMRHAEDFDLWLRIAERHPFASTGRRLVRYRVHAGQHSRHLGRMMASAWQVRRDRWDRAVTEMSPDERQRVIASLHRAFVQDLEMAWHQRSREPLASVLRLHHLVPDGASIHRRWQWRTLLWRPLWLLGARLWDRLPDGARSAWRRRPRLAR